MGRGECGAERAVAVDPLHSSRAIFDMTMASNSAPGPSALDPACSLDMLEAVVRNGAPTDWCVSEVGPARCCSLVIKCHVS